jgi:hypothetical protein
VRRDWSQFASDAGKAVINIIMTDKAQDTRLAEIQVGLPWFLSLVPIRVGSLWTYSTAKHISALITIDVICLPLLPHLIHMKGSGKGKIYLNIFGRKGGLFFAKRHVPPW